MARPRATQDGARLPPYVYLSKGRYVLKSYDKASKKCVSEIVLCPGDTPIAKVWAAYDAAQADGAPRRTLDWLMRQYLASPDYQRLAPVTRKDYAGYARRIAAAPLRNGATFGGVDIASVTPGVIRRYMDKRSETAAKSANRELAFLSVCFGWAYQRDIVKGNPAKGVDRNPEPPRDVYVSDADYALVCAVAGRRYPYVQPIMELAYLCRMRLAEVLDLTLADVSDQGVHVRRRKGSKDNLTLWTPRLQAAIDLAASLPRPYTPIDKAKHHVIPGADGGRMKESTVQTAWQRIMRDEAMAALGQRFTVHDLKAKGISDTDRADQQAAAGHLDGRITARVYDRLPQPVKPSGKE